MRAVFFPELNLADIEISLQREIFHHLKNVVRVKKDEDLLLLNGKGEGAYVRINAITKREIICNVEKIEQRKDNRIFDVAYCLTKKDSFDLAIKMAMELNIKNFFPLISDFSQRYELKKTRIDSLVNSALMQSNAFYKMNVHSLQELGIFFSEKSREYSTLHLFDLIKNKNNRMSKKDRKKLLIIGPEGGFSDRERERFESLENLVSHCLNTNILRASTALPATVGFILGKELL